MILIYGMYSVKKRNMNIDLTNRKKKTNDITFENRYDVTISG